MLMESPDFPLPEGQYLVTGGRETQAVLKVSGDSWSLSHEAKLSEAMLNRKVEIHDLDFMLLPLPKLRKVNFIQHILDSYCLLTILGKLSRDMTIQLLAFRYVI